MSGMMKLQNIGQGKTIFVHFLKKFAKGCRFTLESFHNKKMFEVLRFDKNLKYIIKKWYFFHKIFDKTNIKFETTKRSNKIAFSTARMC